MNIMREQMVEALKAHAQAHIDKHVMNVEIYLENPVGVGEHSCIMDTIEKEIDEIARYQDQLDILNTYF